MCSDVQASLLEGVYIKQTEENKYKEKVGALIDKFLFLQQKTDAKQDIAQNYKLNI